MAGKYQERLEALRRKYGGGQQEASAPSPSPATNGGGIQAKMFQRLGIGTPGATAAPKTPAIPPAPPVAPDVQAFDETPSLVMDMPKLPKYEAPQPRQLEQGPETNPYLSMTNDQLVKAGDTAVADVKVKRQQEAAQVWNKRRTEKLAQLTANDDNLRFMLPELIADMEILPDDVRSIPAAKLPWDRLGQFDGLQQAAQAGRTDPEKGKELLLSVMESREQNPARQALRGFTHGAGEQLTLGLYEPTVTSGSKVEGASEFAGSIVGQVPWSMAGGKVAQGLKVTNPVGQGLITGGMMQTGREAITAAKDPEAYNVVEGLGRVLGNAAEYGAYTGVYSKLTPYMDAKVEQIAQASPNLGRVLQSIPGEAVQSVIRGGAAAVPVGFGKTVIKAFKDGGIDLNTAAKDIADEMGQEVKEEAVEYIALDLAFRLLGGKGPTPHVQGVTPSQTQTAPAQAQTPAPVEQATPAPVQAPVAPQQEAPAPTPPVDEKTPPVASQTQEEASSPQGKSWTNQGLTYTVRNQRADGNWMVTVTDAQGKATPKTYSDKTVRAKLGLPAKVEPAQPAAAVQTPAAETAPEPEAPQVDLEGAEVGKPILSSEVKKGKPKSFGEMVKVGDKVAVEGREGEFTVVDAKDPSMVRVKNANGAELPIGRAKVQPLSAQPANPTQSVEETPSTPKAEEPASSTAGREIITPENDTPVGSNAAGEQLYERADGSRYRMRFDRKDRPNGYPDFGGDLAPVTPAQKVEEPAKPAPTPPVERATHRNMQELRERSTAIQEPLKWERPNQTTWTSGGYTITRLDAKDKAQKGNYQYAVTFNGEPVGEPKTSLPDARVVAQTHVQRARIAEAQERGKAQRENDKRRAEREAIRRVLGQTGNYTRGDVRVRIGFGTGAQTVYTSVSGEVVDAKSFSGDFREAAEYAVNQVLRDDHGEPLFKKGDAVTWEQREGTMTGKVVKAHPSGLVEVEYETPAMWKGRGARLDIQEIRKAQSTTPKGEVEENPAFAGARPATPYVPATPKPLTKVSRRQMVRELSKAFGPIRVGFASKIRGALGIFKSREQVIRTQMAEDFPVILHEVGHKLDAQMKLADPQFDAELIPLGTPTAPQNSTQPYLRGEGVGEFIRLYIMDEQAAQKAAPKFYPHFEAVLAAEPELQAQIQGARTLVKAWYAQNPHDKADGLISVDERGNKRPWSVEKMEAQLVEQLAPLRMATGELAEGRKLTVDEDPFSQALLARGWVGRAKTFLEYGVMDANFKRVGESMKDILHDVPDLDAFRRYIVFKRAQELMDKRKWSVEQTIGTGMTRAEIDQVVSDLKAVYEPLQKRLVKFQDAVLQELVDSGRLEPKEAQAMRQMNEEYVPFHRFFDEQSGMFNFIGANHLANVGNPLKEIQGSGRTVIDPMESIIKNTYSIINASQRNRVGRALLDLAQQAKNKGDVVEVVDENARDSSIVNVWKDGKKYRIKVDPELHRALLFLDREQTALWVKLVGLPARTLRAGAILNPDFMVSNPVVDQFTAYINSEYGYKPFWDLGKGLKSATTKDEKYWQWMAAGGAQANLVSLDRNYLQEELRGLIKSGKLTKGQVLHGINPLTYLRAASELGEIGTRLGEFGRGVERDSSREGILRSSLASRDLALDYAKTGSKTKTVNQISAFWNAGVQGLDKTRRQFVKYPVRTTARAMAAYTIPSIMLFLINKDNPWYEEKDEWMKDAFMMIPLDWSGGLATAQKSEHFLYIPRKHALALTFGALPERILRKWHKDDPKAFDMQFAARFVDNWTPDMPLPTAILPPIENWANKSFYTDLPLVPKREEKLEPVDRYGPTTSEAAKGIARGLDAAGMGVSPRKVDNLVRGWGGGLGTMLTDAASWGMDKAGVGDNVPEADRGAADYPVARRFLRDQGGPGPGSSVDEFYDAVEKMEQKYASMPDSPAKKGVLATLRPWRKAGDAMSELSARKRTILAHPNIDGQEKRRLVDQIDLAMTNIARSMFSREPIR